MSPAKPVAVKICGLKEPEHVHLCAELGVAYFGLVFFEKSPRFVTLAAAKALADIAPATMKSTGLFVKQTPDEVLTISEAVGLDAIQLHGTYDADQCAHIRARWDGPLIRAFSIATAEDFAPVTDFAELIDIALYDAKPPKGSVLPGGNAVSFDWTLLANRPEDMDWMLAGGLTPENVADAIQRTNPPAIDLSSGVESAPGVKSSEKLRAFLSQVATAQNL